MLGKSQVKSKQTTRQKVYTGTQICITISMEYETACCLLYVLHML